MYMCIRRFRSEASNSRIASRWEVIFFLANEHRFLAVTNSQQKLAFRFCIVYCILLNKKKKKCTCIVSKNLLIYEISTAIRHQTVMNLTDFCTKPFNYIYNTFNT